MYMTRVIVSSTDEDRINYFESSSNLSFLEVLFAHMDRNEKDGCYFGHIVRETVVYI